jgi:hypothetical protein
MTLLNSAHCVITGAGAGLGRALALELGRRGGRLVVSDVDAASAEETARLALAGGAAEAKAVRCDVTRLADLEALAEACAGPIDLVVNNAGVCSGGFVGDLSIDDWRWTVEVDLFGVVHGCHVFVPILKRQGRGRLLNVASAAGFVCAPRMGAYNVAKAGVIALSETLAAELEGTGASVTVLCPSFIRTGIVASGRFADAETRGMAERFMARGLPLGEVVVATLAAVERGELYALPMPDARWMWRAKRALPAQFQRLLTRGARLLDRLGSGADGAGR